MNISSLINQPSAPQSAAPNAPPHHTAAAVTTPSSSNHASTLHTHAAAAGGMPTFADAKCSPPVPSAATDLRRQSQSEKKRQWRKSLTAEQREKRQQLDARRKREQRMNLTDEQRTEARRKDAARKAAKRKELKEKLRKEKEEEARAKQEPPLSAQLAVRHTKTVVHPSSRDLRRLPTSHASAQSSRTMRRTNSIEDILN